MTYELYYWPGIQGRGEFVRLALEEAGAAYIDVARERGPGRGMAAMTKLLKGGDAALTPFAPPFLRDGEVVVSHVANILAYLAPKLGLAAATDALRVFAHGLQLTVTDFVAEIHDTHHPISNELYYEDQKKEAKARTAAFLDHRLPKYLGYFERVLESNPDGAGHPIGPALTYVDLSLFQLAEGLSYAFPNTMAKFPAKYPRLAAVRDSVKARPRIAAYLASPRRLPFNEDGVFRCYPELERRPKRG
jgi:glutathione S-transferase